MKWVLSSGREFYANCGILGLNPDDLSEMTHGYDGYVEGAHRDEEDATPLAPGERHEIAKRMNEAWRTWGGVTWADLERIEAANSRAKPEDVV